MVLFPGNLLLLYTEQCSKFFVFPVFQSSVLLYGAHWVEVVLGADGAGGCEVILSCMLTVWVNHFGTGMFHAANIPLVHGKLQLWQKILGSRGEQ